MEDEDWEEGGPRTRMHNGGDRTEESGESAHKVELTWRAHAQRPQLQGSQGPAPHLGAMSKVVGIKHFTAFCPEEEGRGEGVGQQLPLTPVRNSPVV